MNIVVGVTEPGVLVFEQEPVAFGETAAQLVIAVFYRCALVDEGENGVAIGKIALGHILAQTVPILGHGTCEVHLRRKIIEDDLVEGIIAMPTQLFYSVTIPVTLWFITKGKKQKGKTLFIDARKMGHMVDRKHRDFSEEDIQKLADTFEAFQNGTLEDVKGFCAVATLQDIAKQDYILTPGRYVGIEEQEDDGEPFEEKMARLTSELSDMFAKSHELEEEIRRKLGAIGYEI